MATTLSLEDGRAIEFSFVTYREDVIVDGVDTGQNNEVTSLVGVELSADGELTGHELVVRSVVRPLGYSMSYRHLNDFEVIQQSDGSIRVFWTESSSDSYGTFGQSLYSAVVSTELELLAERAVYEADQELGIGATTQNGGSPTLVDVVSLGDGNFYVTHYDDYYRSFLLAAEWPGHVAIIGRNWTDNQTFFQELNTSGEVTRQWTISDGPSGADLTSLHPMADGQVLLFGDGVVAVLDANGDLRIPWTTEASIRAQGFSDDYVFSAENASEWINLIPITWHGTAGNDEFYGGDGNDTIRAGDGYDVIDAGGGNDDIRGGYSSADIRDDIFGMAGNDYIDGGYGNDLLYGGTGADTIVGGFGSDTIAGQQDNDNLSGGALSDEIHGNDGDDYINGGFGYDRLNGGSGADRFFHLGVLDHGSDWIQDYDAAEGDVLNFGQVATLDQFQVNLTETPSAGLAGTEEAFIIYRPTGQIVWALVDGATQDHFTLLLGGAEYDLFV